MSTIQNTGRWQGLRIYFEIMGDEIAKLIQSAEMRNLAFRLGKETKDDIDELMQQVAVNALSNLDKFDGSNIKGWLKVIMKNIVYNETDYKRRHPVSLDSDIYFNLHGGLVHHDKTENRIDYEQKSKLLQIAIKRLPEKNRTPIMLRLAGRTAHEISEELDIKFTSVESRILTGRKILKKII